MKKSDIDTQTVLAHMPLVKMIAARLFGHLPPNFDFDDLVGYGVVGLMEALREFDPEKKVKFSTFAFYRIKRAMLDGLRALDWLPRPLRQKIQRLEAVRNELKNKLGREPHDEELAGSLKIEVNEVRTLIYNEQQSEMISLEEELQDKLSFDETHGTVRINGIEEFELLGILTDTIKNLDERERLILSLYYFEGLNLKEIGSILSCSESRVSQLLSGCIIVLQDKLEHIKSEIKI